MPAKKKQPASASGQRQRKRKAAVKTRARSKSAPSTRRPVRAKAPARAKSASPPRLKPGSWDYMFRMLQIFKRTHGHCDVPSTARRDSLGFWLMQQRLNDLAGDLAPGLRRRLDQLGVAFDHHDLTETRREHRWNEMFEALQEFKKGAGHCRIPAGRPEHAALYQWLRRQRQLHQIEKLRTDRWRRLRAIGADSVHQSSDATRPPSGRKFSWEQRFAQLVQFKKSQGHCQVPKGWPKDPSLANWLNNQRQSANAGHLSQRCCRRLKELGVKWGARKPEWAQRYKDLTAFQRQHGHCRVYGAGSCHESLATWTATQRVKYHKGQLSSGQIRQLEQIGFEWSAHGRRIDPRYERQWEKHLAALKSFHQAHGHCHVPWGCPAHPSLYYWVASVRRNWQAGRLSPLRVAQLDALNFVWQPETPRWETNFYQLTQFAREHGHCVVPMTWNGRRNLSQWVLVLRTRRRKGLLDPRLIARLDAIGFEWSRPHRSTFLTDQLWEKRFATLRSFKEQHGHCNPTLGRPGERALAGWVQRQRSARHAGKLPEARRCRLEALGVSWNGVQGTWEQRFAELGAFQREHGHCRVPDPGGRRCLLNQWCIRQRSLRRRGELSTDQVRRLDELGLLWEPLKAGWEHFYAELLDFRRQHGHSRVPSHQSCTSLSGWALRQRWLRRQGTLTPELERRLDEIGFDWDPIPASWEKFHRELSAFKTEHGHCRVRKGDPAHARLADWVHRQRHLRRNGRLGAERIRRLDEMGFDWTPNALRAPRRSNVWEQTFTAFLEYRQQHVDGDVPADWPRCPGLRGWLQEQSRLRHLGKLDAERSRRLEEAGFDFVVPDRKDLWEPRYAQLVQFHRENGHCRVPLQHPDRAFAKWVMRQRAQPAGLDADRRRRLDALGYEWQRPSTLAVQAAWDKRFAEIMAYKDRFGHTQVPQDWPENRSLAGWVSTQRDLARRNKLPADRRLRLEQIAFDFHCRDFRWETKFAALLEYHREHGRWNVLHRDDPELSGWVGYQRRSHQQGTMHEDHRRRFEAAGFEWEPKPIDLHWEARCQELVEFHRQHGHCRPPHKAPWQKLAEWILRVRQRHALGQLSAERVQHLQALGFDWTSSGPNWHTLDAAWDRQLAALAAFKERFGHTILPEHWPENQPLATWLRHQRHLGQNHQLRADRRRKLEQLGFDFDATEFDAAWERRFGELTAFHHQHGHSRVLPSHQLHSLNLWVMAQRACRRNGKLPPERIQRLDALGFVWDVSALRDPWEEQFARLEEFHHQHGHCRPPHRPPWQQLGEWAHRVRQRHTRGQLNPDRVRRLEALGFEWTPRATSHPALDDAWEKQLQSLTTFKQQFGHTIVPGRYEEIPGLGKWVRMQRQHAKNGTLREERRRRLEAIGFVFDRNQTVWEEQFARLRAFHQSHGHCRLPFRGSEELYYWARNQRLNRARGILAADYIQRLDALGFDWIPRALAQPALPAPDRERSGANPNPSLPPTLPSRSETALPNQDIGTGTSGEKSF